MIRQCELTSVNCLCLLLPVTTMTASQPGLVAISKVLLWCCQARIRRWLLQLPFWPSYYLADLNREIIVKRDKCL
jgi:hypothetical protein